MDCNLSWKYHISHVESKISSTIGVIARLRHIFEFTTSAILLCQTLQLTISK